MSWQSRERQRHTEAAKAARQARRKKPNQEELVTPEKHNHNKGKTLFGVLISRPLRVVPLRWRMRLYGWWATR